MPKDGSKCTGSASVHSRAEAASHCGAYFIQEMQNRLNAKRADDKMMPLRAWIPSRARHHWPGEIYVSPGHLFHFTTFRKLSCRPRRRKPAIVLKWSRKLWRLI
jgi:hypothetical protein